MRASRVTRVTGGDAGSPADTSEASSGAWHIDLDFGDGGYQVLTSPDGVLPCALQLLGPPDASPLIVGVTYGSSLVTYSALQAAPLKMFTGMDLSFGGAVLSPGSSTTIEALTVQRGEDVTAYAFDVVSSDNEVTTASQTNLVFARLIDVQPGLVVHSVGSVGSNPAQAADLVVNGGSAQGTPLPASITASMTLAKTELMAADGTTYYGGICASDLCDPTATQASYGVVLPDGGAQGSAVITSLSPPSDGAGLTDLIAVGEDVYAVGFDDRAFVLVKLSPDGRAAALGTILANDRNSETFLGTNDPALDSQTQLLGVLDGAQILVGGSFDGVKLAAFDLDGSTAAGAFAEIGVDGGLSYPSVIDLADSLPVQSGGTEWYFQTMLLEGSYLYVTASTAAGPGGEWVVLRLVKTALSR